MPELPEVQTTTTSLNNVLVGLKFTDVWTDIAKKNQPIKHFKNTIKDLKFFEEFKSKIIDKKIIKVVRRGKNILIHLSTGNVVLIHLKMTGHLLYGIYDKVIENKKTIWKPVSPAGLFDPYNRHIHVMFNLNNKKFLAFCDSRKFGKITLINKKDLNSNIHTGYLGYEPLDKDFTFSIFKKQIYKKLNGKIKSVLLDQTLIAGIGNIYSDEALWLTTIYPEEKVSNITDKNLKELYKNIKKVLKLGIQFGGDSTSDYRNINGLPGNFQHKHNVYRRKGEKCNRKGCIGTITRKVIGGRSSHYCNNHQKLVR